MVLYNRRDGTFYSKTTCFIARDDDDIATSNIIQLISCTTKSYKDNDIKRKNE
jgi:hypothetical protein